MPEVVFAGGLYGLLWNAGGDTVVIAIHGTASNFYENDFYGPVAEKLANKKVAFLAANNRGADVLQAYPLKGAGLERFEDCTLDIDAWVGWARGRGFTRVVLVGHSLGAEKTVYYLAKGKLRKHIAAVILLAPADSYGYHLTTEKQRTMLLKEAKRLVAAGKGDQFLTTVWLCHGKVIPKSGTSYLNFFREGSALSKALPFHTKKLLLYKSIHVPVLVVIGDSEKEYTVIPVKEALELMRTENERTECYQMRNCDHDFAGRETELARVVAFFMDKVLAGS